MTREGTISIALAVLTLLGALATCVSVYVSSGARERDHEELLLLRERCAR